MSTCNFGQPHFGLPLVAGFVEGDFENEYEEQYEEEALYENVKFDVEELNLDLDFFEVEIIPGYYEGFYLDAKWTSDYWMFEELDELEDEDADYFWGESAKTIRDRAYKEFEKVKQFFEEMSKTNLIELKRVGVFSNGEGVYKRV